MEKEWKVVVWESHGIVIDSNDFTHDASLVVNGDFESIEQHIAYAEKLADKLNGNDSIE